MRLHEEVVAETTRPVLLLETGLVTRYYIPSADIRRDLFVPSQSYSKCPYKGTASYLTYRSADRQIDDAAWHYPSPLRDVRKITGHVCFWNERPETTIEVDGVELAHLGVRRSAAGGELLYPSRRFFAVPPPASMAGAMPGQLQHDFARPNGRVEGPPDELIDMDVERAGGRRSSFVSNDEGRAPTGHIGGSGAAGGGSSLMFTFGRSKSAVAAGAQQDQRQPTVDETRIDLGPARICERSLRQVRAVVGGVVVADSSDVVLYAGDDSKATYYFPTEDVRRDLLSDSGETSNGPGLGPLRHYLLQIAPRSSSATGTAAAFSPVAPPPALGVLRDRIAFDWGSVDAWFEEDDEVRGSPRVPYHRVDAIHSGRHIVVTLAGRLLAESRRTVAVFETNLPARYYLSRLDTALGLLTPSDRRDESPYLGTASYFSAVLNGGLYADVAWSYPFPIPECSKVAGLICFDESVAKVEVDGSTST